MAAGGEFEWRPGAPRRRRSTLLAVPVLAACAAAGAGLSWLLPIDKLVVAIERNGVPPPPAEPTTATALARSELPPISATAPPPSPQPGPPPEVVVINSGTARAVDVDEPMVGSASSEVEQRRPATAITGQPAPETALPPSARHRNSSDRRVLVVVRRTGPPYDIKILRGRMSNGRLIVDSRDRRGLTIR